MPTPQSTSEDHEDLLLKLSPSGPLFGARRPGPDVRPMALAPGTPPVAPPVPRVPPALACEDWPRWRRFRQRFARWARPSRRGERPLGRPGGRLVAEAKDLVRNASEGEFTRPGQVDAADLWSQGASCGRGRSVIPR